MKQNKQYGVQEFDFDWTMKYLGITNKQMIAQYLEWNKEMCQISNSNEGESSEPKYSPFKIFANKSFRGSAAGHYIPIANIVEIKEYIDEENPTLWQKLLVAHEFAHALIDRKKIIGNRGGHGVLYYLCLMRDVIWYANSFSLFEKFTAMVDEFSYSCSLGQYRVSNYIFRSQSCSISLPLDYFTINSLFLDRRSDINNLGEWMWEKISEQIGNAENKNELLDTPIVDLIKQIEQTKKDKKIIVSEEEHFKMLRR